MAAMRHHRPSSDPKPEANSVCSLASQAPRAIKLEIELCWSEARPAIENGDGRAVVQNHGDNAVRWREFKRILDEIS